MNFGLPVWLREAFPATEGVVTTKGRVVRNLFFKSIADVSPKALTFIITVITARLLGEADFGRLAYALTVASLLAMPLDFGWNNVVIRRLAAQKDFSVVDTAFRLKSWALLPTVLIALGVGLWMSKAGMQVPLWLTLTACGVTVCYVFQDFMGSISIGLERIEWEAVVKIVPRLLLLASLGTLAFFRPLPVSTIVGAWLVCHGAGLLLTAAWFRRKIAEPLPASDWPMRQRFLREAAWFGCVAAVWLIYQRQDVILLGWFAASSADVGYYATAARLFELGRSGPLIIQLALIPVFSSFAHDEQRIRRQVRLSVTALAPVAVLTAAAFWFFSEPLVRILFGEPFAPAARPLLIGGMAMSITILNVPLIAALTARGRNRALFATLMSALIVNAVSNLVLIPQYSYTGPAWSYVVSEVVWITLNLFVFVSHGAKN